MLRGRPRLEPELGLERADRPLALAQQLDDPDARRMTEHPEQPGLHLVHGTHAARHGEQGYRKSLYLRRYGELKSKTACSPRESHRPREPA